MAGLISQFHALPEELLPLVSTFVEETGAHATAMRFPPFSAWEVHKELLPSAFEDDSVWRVAFTLVRPSLPVGGTNEFLDHHPEALLLNLGRKTSAGLEESCLSARTEGTEALTTWRKLAKRVKAITRTGVIAVNPETGASRRSKDRRYSAGAKVLAQAGVPMLPVAGGARFRFED